MFALIAMVSLAASASADQIVVRALVYDGSPGASVPQQIALSALSNCVPYDGPSPLYLYLGGASAPPPSPYPLPSTTWTVATVLSCALQVPLGDVTAVQIARGNAYQGYEAPLTSAQLTDPSQFQDPQAPGALPVISTDGSEDQNTYTRPWLGGSDDNAADQVTVDNAPVTIAIYENAAPLVVHVHWTRVSQNAAAVRIKFRPTVQTASGTLVPAGALTWSWDFADGAPSTAATPTHSFPIGVSPVSVQVTDASTGAAGTATVDVSAQTSPASGKHTHIGGNKKTSSTSPVGADHGGTSGGNENSAGTSTTTGAPTTTTSAAPATRPTTAPSSKPAVRTHHPATRHRPEPPPVVDGTVVNGLLISDVQPDGSLIKNASSSKRDVPQQVRQAARASSASILLSGIIVITLLGLGAGRELRSSRRSVASASGS